MNRDPPTDVDAYLLNSKYRRAVVEHLGSEGASTPKEIAAATDKRRPHVSRALGELADRGIVELRVDEGRQVGRYYGLTDDGIAAWERVRDELRHVPWSVEPPEDPTASSIVETAARELGDKLRTVVRYDGERVEFLYVAPGVLERYTESELERAIQSFVFDHRLESMTVPHETVQSEAITFEAFSCVRVLDASGGQWVVTFDNETDVEIPGFTRTLRAILEDDEE